MIARHFLRIQRGALIGWSVVLFLLAYTIGNATTVMRDMEAVKAIYSALPPVFQKLSGSDLIMSQNPADGYLAMKWFLLLPVIMGIYAALTGASIVARENERGTIGFLLALPVERARVLRERFLTLAGMLAWLYLVQGFGIWVGMTVVDMAGSPARWALLCLGFYAINLAMAGITLFFSLHVPSWSRSVQVGVGLVIGLYLVDYGLASADVAVAVRAPFLYALADIRASLLDGQLPWAALLVGLGLMLLTLYLSERRFARQQITA